MLSNPMDPSQGGTCCTPKKCSDFKNGQGKLYCKATNDDGCGGNLDCSKDCGAGDVCAKDSAGALACCTPKTCNSPEYAGKCGIFPDGCGGYTQLCKGACTSGQICVGFDKGSGTPGSCCTSATCNGTTACGVMDACTGKTLNCCGNSNQVCQNNTTCCTETTTCSTLANLNKCKGDDGCGDALDCGDGNCRTGNKPNGYCDPNGNCQCAAQTDCTQFKDAQGRQACGIFSDGCGGTVNCTGDCSALGQTCSSTDPNTPGFCCTKLTTAACTTCGTISDGCGGTIDCGVALCGSQQCVPTGTTYSCCTPKTCSDYAGASPPATQQCGTLPSGCGTGTIKCNAASVCPGGDTCADCSTSPCKPAGNNGSGTCCQPLTCAAFAGCGVFDDGCGGKTPFCNTGCSGANQRCEQSDAQKMADQPGYCCNLAACSAYPGKCGTLPDGCNMGGTIFCPYTTSCAGTQVCDNAGDCCTPKTCGGTWECGTSLDPGCDQSKTDCGCPGTMKCTMDGHDTAPPAPGTGGHCCQPKSCADYPDEHGTLSDGCGGTISCNCPSGEVPMGSNVCCHPNFTQCPAHPTCGTLMNSCGQTFDCTNCGAPPGPPPPAGCLPASEACTGGKCACSPSASLSTAACVCSGAVYKGPQNDGCGGVVTCPGG
jgi:hypothetical protein